MTTSALLTLSVALLAGLLLSRLAKLVGLPAVTAYLVAGVLIGPFILGRIGIGFNFTDNSPEHYKILCDLALGFIAFAIGNEFRLNQLKKIGKQATVIGIFQAVFTCIIVDIVLVIVSLIAGEDVFPMSAAVILGAVATATAPAATLMVVKQYKAKGPLTDLLLPIVALDACQNNSQETQGLSPSLRQDGTYTRHTTLQSPRTPFHPLNRSLQPTHEYSRENTSAPHRECSRKALPFSSA